MRGYAPNGGTSISVLGENDFSDDEGNASTEEGGVPLQDMRGARSVPGDYTGMGSSDVGFQPPMMPRGGPRHHAGDPQQQLGEPGAYNTQHQAPGGPREGIQEKEDRDEKESSRAVTDDSDDGFKMILANEKSYFDLLFTMLQIGGDISLKVWNLLSSLPVNRELADEIRAIPTVPSPDWDKLLPANPMKLLYALQIVDDNATPSADDPAIKASTAAFAAALVAKGGLQRLYNLLVQQTDNKAAVFSEQLRQQCLTLLLRLFSQLYLDDATRKGDAFVKMEDLTSRLLSTLHACVHSQITGMPKEEKKAKAVERVPLSYGEGRGGGMMGEGGERGQQQQQQREKDEKDAKEGEVTKTYTRITTRDVGDLAWSACALLLAVTTRKPSTLDIAYKFDKWEDLIVTGLLNSPVKKLRENLAEGLFQWSVAFDKQQVAKAPRAHLLPLLLKCLPYIDTRSAHCAQYFDLITRLLRDTNAESLVDPETLSKNMSEKIRSHPFLERRASDNDSVLIGLLGLTKELVAQFPSLKEKLGSREHNLVTEVFNCLFDVPKTTMKSSTSNAPPKCKSPAARKSGFALLGELAKGCRPNYLLLLQLLQPNHLVSHSDGRHPEDWGFESKTEEKSESGYVGLRNLGCICYMNSLTQQIFMIPKLRQDILAIDLESKADKDDDPIYQFQYIMGVLQESEKQYCDPVGFCKAFKDWDGQPINVSVQDDSAGFLNKLIDKFSDKLKGTPGEHVFKKSIGGYMANELFGRGECKHYRERAEEYFVIQVEIKNKKTLEEALRATTKGEVISDYRCSDCNKKVEVLKRNCIKTLPETVAICLKRFALDYETMQTTKLNDRLEFPLNLDLKPYSKGNLPKEDGIPDPPKPAPSADGKDSADGKGKDEDAHPDEYYQYELVGAIVHTGTAGGGHYYSYIRERLTDDMIEKGIEPQWFEFNDRIVRPFDPKDIEEECFGGSEEYIPRGWSYNGSGSGYGYTQIGPPTRFDVTGGGGGGGHSSVGSPAPKPILRERSNNAYVLFYDRIKPRTKKGAAAAAPTPAPVPAPVPAPSSPPPAAAATATTTTDLAKPALDRQVSTKAAVPPQLFKQIWQQNTTYWRDRAVFDPLYFQFLWTLVSDAPTVMHKIAATGAPDPQDELYLKVIEFSTRFVFMTLSRAYYKNSLGRWADFLKKAYSENPKAGLWLIDAMSSETWNADFLLVCPNAEVRKSVASLVCRVLDAVCTLEHDSFAKLPLPLAKGEPKAEEKKADASRGFAVKYVDNLVSLLKVAPLHWKRFDQYFKVLAHFAELGGAEAGYLLAGHNLLARLVDFYLGDDSPLKDVGDMPLDSKGRRVVMGGDLVSPDIMHFLQLLRALVLASDTEAIRSGKPAPPSWFRNKSDNKNYKPVPLSESAHRLLLGKEFMNRLLTDGPTTRKCGQHVAAIVNHHCYENLKFSREVIGLITQVIEESVFDEVRPVFRVFNSLITIQDSIHNDRIEWALSALLATMKQQDKYWKITDLCIEHLIRLAKKNAEVFAWLASHADRWAWLIDWIGAFPQQPSGMGDGQVSLYKPNKQSHRISAWSSRLSYSTSLHWKRKKATLELIREGKEIDKTDASDSDEDLSERVFTLNQKVDCKDTANKWLISTVIELKEGYVYIHYDGWSSKWDEWLETSDPRIAKLHRYTPPQAEPVALPAAAQAAGASTTASGESSEGATSSSTSTALVVAGTQTSSTGSAPDP